MQLCWVFDEYSDRESEAKIRHMANAIMLGIRDPHVHQESTLGEIARQYVHALYFLPILTLILGRFGARVVTVLNSQNRARFIECFQDYTDAIVQRAHDKDRAYVRNIPDYFRVRRETIGMRPAFAFLQFDMHIPDEVLEHPTIVQLQTLASDMVILGNVCGAPRVVAT